MCNTVASVAIEWHVWGHIIITDTRGMGVARSSAWTIEWHLWDCDADISRVPGEIKSREVELDPQVSPEEIISREMELGCESWTSFASGCSSTAVQRTLSL